MSYWRLLVGALLRGVGSLAGLVASVVWFGQFLIANQSLHATDAAFRAVLLLLVGLFDLWWALSSEWRHLSPIL